MRDYQQATADAVDRELESNNSTLAVCPTGTGKTVIIAECIRRRLPKRTMVIAHREELIFQAKDKIEKWAEVPCEVEMADMVASVSLFHATPVVVASVQTLISGRARRRMERFNPDEFGLLVIDEAHHAAADSYKAIIAHFRQNPFLKVLGVTATPDRADELALGQIFDTVAMDYEITDAIDDGWLVPVDQRFVSIHGLDFSAVKTTAGDLNGADLAAVMEQEKNMQGLCGATLELIGERQTIFFASSVAHAEMSCNIFNRARPGIAEWISGTTPKEDRRKTMDNMKSGKTQILCNVGIATEGFDVPGIEIIAMGRPTKSRALYAQMAGRALRPLPGIVDGLDSPEARRAAITNSRKPAMLLIDFVGNSGRHKLMSGLDILGGKHSDEAIALALRNAKEGGQKRLSESLDEAEAQLREQERRAQELRERRAEEAARKARLVAKVEFKTNAVDPFSMFGLKVGTEKNWEQGKTLSEKQRSMLVKQGINPDSMPYQKAKSLLNELFRRFSGELCSVKQAQLLTKHGYDTKSLGRKDASALIGALAKNNWRRPQYVTA